MKQYNPGKIAQRKRALRLFRVFHGKGDAGSEAEFNNSAPEFGWMALARFTLRREHDARVEAIIVIRKELG